jgi:acyl-CoA reductase-like NAD-dependent aldehyde dehydrogenase
MAITLHGSFQYPTTASDIPPTSREQMDAAVQTLQAHKDEWIARTIPQRIALIDQLMRDFWAVSDRMVAAGVQAKGLDPNSPTAGEEWALGPFPIMRNFRLLRESLRDIQRSGRPRIPGRVTTLPNGQVAARVFPGNTYDRLLFTGVTADVWMEPGVTRAELPTTQAVAYHDPNPRARVALVLSAGNVASIGPLDLAYKLFVENQVVLLKANPVNAYLGPLMEEAFHTLVEQGFLRFVYGGAAEGAYLCNHDGVDEIHITGSDKTFDAIVFGPGPEGAARKAERRPLLNKRVTGELGNVSPVIVVPGPWSASDLAYQADHLASMLTNNAGFNCNATRVIIQHAAWPQRDALLSKVGERFSAVPTRPAYYPGAHDRHRAFVSAHPDARTFGQPSGLDLPWTLIPGADPSRDDDIAFTTEAFCGVFAETPLDASNTPEFIDRAVAFCNDRLWGTLNATILVHPASLKDPATAAAVDRAIANLRFGAIGVNYWAAAAFLLGQTPWGGYPGSAVYDIQSGNDWVHNTLMFSRPQKSVVRAPFRSMPTPPFFVSRARVTGTVFRRLTELEMSPSPAKAMSVAMAAMG